jgi:L-aspartate oxidase
MLNTDVLIIGCGIAGATAALRLARNPNRRILVLTRDPDPQESNSRYAQGGIIGRGQDDTADLLYQDILEAGAGASTSTASLTANLNTAARRPIPAGVFYTWATAPGRPSSPA